MDFQAPKTINLGGSFKPSSRSIFEVVLLISLIILFNWFLLLPKKNSEKVLNTKLAELKARANLSSNNLQSLEGLTQGLPANEKFFTKLDQALPLSGQPLHLKVLLNKLAEESAVTISSINVVGKNNQIAAGNLALNANPYNVDRKIQILTADISVVGTFDQVQGLLRKIETDGRIMNLTSLQFATYQGGQVQMTLNLEAYYYGPV